MAAQLNELLEEGITRCGEMTAAVDAAMDAMDAMAEQARETAEQVQREADEARRRMRDVAGRLEEAAGEIGGARQEAEGALERLAGKAAALDEDAGSLVERVSDAAAKVERQRNRIDQSLEGRMTTTRDDLSELAERTRELQAEAQRRLDQAGDALTALRAACETSRAELTRKKEEWDEALDELETRAQQQVGACVAGLQGMLQRQGTALVTAANVMVDRHNHAMDVIRREFAREAPGDLDTALEPFQAALRSVAEEAAAREQSLASRVEELKVALVEPVPGWGELKAALEDAAELG